MARDGFKVMDSDMHIFEPPDLWERYIDPKFKDRAPKCATGEARDFGMRLEGYTIPNPKIHDEPRAVKGRQQAEENQRARYESSIARGWNPLSQVDAMDAEGIDVAVLYPSRALVPFGIDGLDPELADAIAMAYNNWLYDFCQADPSRMYGAGMVPVYDVNLAVKEARRCVEKLGFRGIFMRPTVINGRSWHNKYYDPLWHEIEALGVPIGFHEGGSVPGPQASKYLEPPEVLHQICSHPLEMMLSATSMIGGGVLERFPKLRVAYLEGNCSWLPWFLWRMDEVLEPGSWGSFQQPDLTMLPSEYFRRQCFVSVECDELPAQYLEHAGFVDNVIFSTDYPHLDAKYPEAVINFLEMPFSADTKRKLLWDNCARYYGFGEGRALAEHEGELTEGVER